MTTHTKIIKALESEERVARTKNIASIKVALDAMNNDESNVYQDMCKKSVDVTEGYLNGILEAIEIVQKIKED